MTVAFRKRASNVFLNMPFEPKGKYRDLLVAYVTGLAGLGFTARSVLELPQTQNRLERLREMIEKCPSSIHDLSCVALTDDCPRFNMPFELGMAVRPGARWFVFEEVAHRLVKSLSDINGHDPLIHNGNTRNVLAKLQDCFRSKRDTTTAELEDLRLDVEKLAAHLEAQQGSLLGAKAFGSLVVGAQRLAEARGLI